MVETIWIQGTWVDDYSRAGPCATSRPNSSGNKVRNLLNNYTGKRTVFNFSGQQGSPPEKYWATPDQKVKWDKEWKRTYDCKNLLYPYPFDNLPETLESEWHLETVPLENIKWASLTILYLDELKERLGERVLTIDQRCLYYNAESIFMESHKRRKISQELANRLGPFKKTGPYQYTKVGGEKRQQPKPAPKPAQNKKQQSSARQNNPGRQNHNNSSKENKNDKEDIEIEFVISSSSDSSDDEGEEVPLLREAKLQAGPASKRREYAIRGIIMALETVLGMVKDLLQK